jgi:hypothetical protein
VHMLAWIRIGSQRSTTRPANHEVRPHGMDDEIGNTNSQLHTSFHVNITPEFMSFFPEGRLGRHGPAGPTPSVPPTYTQIRHHHFKAQQPSARSEVIGNVVVVFLM